MTPEATFTKWFSTHLPVNWHYQRIETTTGRGVPDAQICAGPGREFWVEFKVGGRRTGP